jgi:hypothetical protein
MLHVKTVKLSAQWKRQEMVLGVDDGPKTDWLLAALEKTLGLSSVCWSKLGISVLTEHFY